MKLIAGFLLTNPSWAYSRVGDSYNCIMINSIILEDGKIIKEDLKKINFTWNQDQIIFGSDGYLSEVSIPLTISWGEQESFRAQSSTSTVNFKNKIFNYSASYFYTISAIQAVCEKAS